MLYRADFPTNNDLVNHLIATKRLKTPAIIEAFRNIDRADFVPAELQEERYGDYPLPIGYHQTISQPTTVAIMLELLQPQQGDAVLDIGSGSGYTTALLAYISGKKVTGVEIVEPLIAFARKNVKRYPFLDIDIEQATDKLGLPDKRFDAILVNAAAKYFPKEFTEQLRPGGRLVIPVQDFIIYGVKEENGSFKEQSLYGFSFVPLLH